MGPIGRFIRARLEHTRTKLLRISQGVLLELLELLIHTLLVVVRPPPGTYFGFWQNLYWMTSTAHQTTLTDISPTNDQLDLGLRLTNWLLAFN